MKRLCKLFLLSLLIPVTIAAKSEKNDSIRILWVGNSYTYVNDLPRLVQQLGESKKQKYSMTRVLKGGERFSGHLQNKRLIQLLKEGGWDYVVLQEQSSVPAQSTREVLTDVYPYAHKIDSMAKNGSPEVKVIYYQTWGHKYGNTNSEKTSYPFDDTYEGMQARIITTYLELAYENNSWCAPVGMAWKRVRAEHPEYVLYHPDCSHPSPTGSYLAANVIFSTIYQKRYQSSFTLDLPEEKAENLQRIAQETVFDNLELLNIKK